MISDIDFELDASYRLYWSMDVSDDITISLYLHNKYGFVTVYRAYKDKNKKEMIENYPKTLKYKKMLEGKDIKPYYPQFANRYILYEKRLLYRARDESIFLSREKIITQRIGGGNNVLVVSLMSVLLESSL